MKKLTDDDLYLFRDFVLKRCDNYEQRLKWHDEDIRELQNDVKILNRLVITLFVQIIALITLLIIWSW